MEGQGRDSENGSEGEPTTMTTNSWGKKKQHKQQRSSVTYNNSENDFSYQSRSHSGLPAVNSDNIVPKCVAFFL